MHNSASLLAFLGGCTGVLVYWCTRSYVLPWWLGGWVGGWLAVQHPPPHQWDNSGSLGFPKFWVGGSRNSAPPTPSLSRPLSRTPIWIAM